MKAKNPHGFRPDGAFRAVAAAGKDPAIAQAEDSLRRRQGVSRPSRGTACRVTFNGITDSWAGWARRLGMTKSALFARRRRVGYQAGDAETLAKILVPLEKPGATRKKFVFDAPPPLPPRKR